MNEKVKGLAGENRAAHFLRGHGYVILKRNYRTVAGEIDIIARNSDELIFIEVKHWKNLTFENLEYAINRTKQKRIIESSKKYVYENPVFADFNLRYDVILISDNDNNIYHINNAFSEVD
jgi:putative endonuclease